MTKTTLKDRVELFDAIFKTPSNKRRPIFEAYAEKHGLKLESVRVMYSKMLKQYRKEHPEKSKGGQPRDKSPLWTKWYKQIIESANPKELKEEAAKQLGITIRSLEVKLARERARINPEIVKKRNMKPAVEVVKATETLLEKADVIVDNLAETTRELTDLPEGSEGWGRVRSDARAVADLIYKKLGIGAPTTILQVNQITRETLVIISKNEPKLKELLALWESDEDAMRALWSWIEPRARVRGWR